MAGGVSQDYLLTIFRTIEHPATIDEIWKIRGDAVDRLVLGPMVESGVHYGFVREDAGKFFPSEALLEYGIERMQGALTLYQEWLDSLKRQKESLGGNSA